MTVVPTKSKPMNIVDTVWRRKGKPRRPLKSMIKPVLPVLPLDIVNAMIARTVGAELVRSGDARCCDCGCEVSERNQCFECFPQ